MILDNTFDRILVISLPAAVSRRERAMQELQGRGLSSRAQIQIAVKPFRDDLPEWWPNGIGAYGCYLSHLDALQQALAEGVERLLILEDDCVWKADAAARCQSFLVRAPEDWGQLYFGGQHRIHPLPVPGVPGIFRASSIFRTHAYAVHARAMPSVIEHLLDWKRFKAAKILEKKHHIDHHFELAHRSRQWPAYCPGEWIAGQGPNSSDISGKVHEATQWWQWASLIEPTPHEH